MNAKEAIQILADEAEELGAEAEDTQGIVRALVKSQGLDFCAWFCVCCELADREARKEGFKSANDRAVKAMRNRRKGSKP